MMSAILTASPKLKVASLPDGTRMAVFRCRRLYLNVWEPTKPEPTLAVRVTEVFLSPVLFTVGRPISTTP
ncbi:hypothetical protein D3C80_2007160 [compost metagenome]